MGGPVRIGELSRTSGIPVATIKYYMRVGLLPPGAHTHPNQADYGEAHLTRLRLVRALTEVGGLSISTASELLAVLDTRSLDAWESVGKVQYTLERRNIADVDQLVDEAHARTVEELIARHGWHIRPDSPARRSLVQICATLHRLGHDDILAALDGYADAIAPIVAVDMSLIGDQTSMSATIEKVIVGTVLGDGLLRALRQLAQEDASRPLLQHHLSSEK
jgi:DNA-binding transcriptional MerR regulator